MIYFLLMFMQTANATLPAGFKALHVSIPSSCKLQEIPVKVEHDPYKPVTSCVDGHFEAVSSVMAKVYRIVDGDTIHIEINKKIYAVRMLGMDTPELHFYDRAQPVWGVKAKEHLASLVAPGDAVRAEFDQTKCDKYGRILVHIFKGSLNLNYEQVKSGLAANYCIAPNMHYCDQFAAAYRNAELNQLGMHADRCVVTPYVWRRAMMNHSMDKRVKDVQTGVVYSPSEYYKVPVADRVFEAASNNE